MTNNVAQQAQESIQQLRRELNARSFAREAEVDGLLVAIISQEHVLLLGPPGTNKSGLVNDLVGCLEGDFFRQLMGKTTPPEALFGVVPPKTLLNAEDFIRKTTGKLPEARWAFLDEIFKANDSILNDLLSVINERIFDNGPHTMQCPLNTVFGASNETPEDDSLAALDDRFLIRYWVNYLSDSDMLALQDQVEDGGRPVMTATLSLAAIAALQATAAAIPFPAEERIKLVALRRAVRDKGFQASDRAWVAAPKLIKAYALLLGDSVVTSDHFAILQHSLWRKETDRHDLAAVVAEHASELLRKAQKLRAVLTAELEAFQQAEATGNWRGSVDRTFAALSQVATEMQDAIDAARQRGRPVPPDALTVVREAQKQGAAIAAKLTDGFRARREEDFGVGNVAAGGKRSTTRL